MHAQFIVETLARGAAKAKTLGRPADARRPAGQRRGGRVHPSGTLLLGLRFPVTEAGEPILVEVAGVAGMFDDDPQHLADGRPARTC